MNRETLRLSRAHAFPSPSSPAKDDLEQVLIVEDERDIATMMAELLTLAGFSVVIASDAVFGLAALRTRRFRIVLSDHRMPGRTGVDMLREARAEGLLDGVAALILSADELVGVPWQALRKPVRFDDLLARMHQAMDECAAGVRALD